MRAMYIGIIRGYMIRLENSDKNEDPFFEHIGRKQQFYFTLQSL